MTTKHMIKSKTLCFKNGFAKETFSEINKYNRRITDIVGDKPFDVRYNRDANWQIVNKSTGLPYIDWYMFLTSKEINDYCYVINSEQEVLESVPSEDSTVAKHFKLESEVTLSIGDLKINKSNYKDVVDFITKSFEA